MFSVDHSDFEQGERLFMAIERRLQGLISRAAEGHDVPPAALLRLEGLCEAAVLCDHVSQAALDALIERCCGDGDVCAAHPGSEWRKQYPFPQLPLLMRRAPVSVSASE